MLEVRFQEWLETLFPNKTLQARKQRHSFDVRHSGKSVIRITASTKIWNKPREIVVLTEMVYAFAQRLESVRQLELLFLCTIHIFDDLQLSEHSEPFIQPKVFPRLIRH